jgi:glycosyltransferase involved in cell wall biosynthesis
MASNADHPQDPEATPTGEAWEHTFTIFIPTYNRAWCLPRALQSISESRFRDFEVIVIDDGSTDDTRELIAQWQTNVDYPLRYIYQENAGKAAAHNRAVDEARGFLFMTVDSDDSLLPDALEGIKRQWDAIPEEQKPSFAGVCGHCLDETGELSGSKFPRDTIDSDYLEIASMVPHWGEKREAIRTTVMREYLFPLIEGEKHLRPTLILRRMAHRYKMRFANLTLQINRHEADGISKNRRRYRQRNPKGLRLAFLEEVTMHDRYTDPGQLRRNHVRYVRYSLHSGVGLHRQIREIKHPWYWLIAVPAGVAGWLGDRLRRLTERTRG